jgi:archaellum component FlaC
MPLRPNRKKTNHIIYYFKERMSKKFIKLSGKYYKEVDLNTMSREQLQELIENVREVKEQVSAQILSPFEVQKERIGTAPWNPNRI